MPAKKKPAKSKPARKPKAATRVTKKPASRKASKPKKSARKPTSRSPKPSSRASGLSGHAKRMAMFSEKVIAEEEAPVAVRTFNEARAGIEQSKVLDIKSGSVTPLAPTAAPARKSQQPAPVPADEDEEDLVDFTEVPAEQPPTRSPTGIRPLTGDLAVPKRTNPMEQEFRIGPAAKKGKKGAPPTKDEFGKIELRMQRGSKDETIARANPDYLQRSFNKAAQKGKVAASASTKADGESTPDEFHVAMDKGQRRVDATLSDFGDVEIAQQTRRGSKKVGKLDKDENEGES